VARAREGTDAARRDLDGILRGLVGIEPAAVESGPAPYESRRSLIEPKQLAAFAAHLAEAKKGVDITVYDVNEHIKIASYFVVVTGLSRPHVQAITNEIHTRLKEFGERHTKAEGADLGWWVLLDFADVVVHVLQPEARQYYALDQLYAECPILDVDSIALPSLAEPRAARAAE
jgi:ribosome-associated protein